MITPEHAKQALQQLIVAIDSGDIEVQSVEVTAKSKDTGVTPDGWVTREATKGVVFRIKAQRIAPAHKWAV